MIDFDMTDTYPEEIRQWVIEKKNYFLSKVPYGSYEFDYEIEHVLCDIWFDDFPDIKKFISDNQETEFTAWHNARVYDKESYLNNGIQSFGGDIEEARRRESEILDIIGLGQVEKKQLLDKMEVYWKRDKETRTNRVHFYLSDVQKNDAQLLEFASNLGGEILRWSLSAIDETLYRKEPYKKLWLLGKPCRIKFKYKLKELPYLEQVQIIKNIIIYFALKEVYGFECIPEDTGSKIGNVSPNNILKIDEVPDFVERLEVYEEYKDFYNT